MCTISLWKPLALSVLTCVLAFSVPAAKASVNCDTHLLSGSGKRKIEICVSDHGNLVKFESPAFFEHLFCCGTSPVVGEGYAVCPEFNVGGPYDAGFAESGWGAATKSQPNGSNTFPLTITRTTTDGSLKLEQRFAWDVFQKEVTIEMTLTNESGVALHGVRLSRYADFDVDGTAGDDIFSETPDSVFAHQGLRNVLNSWSDLGHGMSLTALDFGIDRFARIEPFSTWESSGYQHCFPTSPVVGPTDGSSDHPPGGNYVARVTFDIQDIGAGVSKTVKVVYRRF